MEDKIKIEQYYKPGLEHGEYAISVSQNLVGIAKIKEEKRNFIIKAPRFSIHDSEIHNQFPIKGSQGRYANSLPHIVLNKRVLPWERKIKKQPNAPWMALLTFSEDEVPATRIMTVKKFLNPNSELTILSQSIMVPSYNPPPSAGDMETLCESIEIPLKLFVDIAPLDTELEYLAHCKTVNAGNKTEIDMPHEGLFSIVVGNRLPANDKQNTVHLVSLEGCEKWISGQLLSEAESSKSIRIISLASWSFYCNSTQSGFKEIVEPLVSRSDLSLKLSEDIYKDSPNIHVRNMFKLGYMTLPYKMMDGANSFAWYRGPLSPIPVEGEAPQRLFLSAPHAMIFDPKNGGIFDQSYAVAWQLGRILAIADNEVGLHIMNLRRKIYHHLDRFYDWFSHHGHVRVEHGNNLRDVRDSLNEIDDHFKNAIHRNFPNLDQRPGMIKETVDEHEAHIEKLGKDFKNHQKAEVIIGEVFNPEMAAKLITNFKTEPRPSATSYSSNSPNYIHGFKSFIQLWEKNQLKFDTPTFSESLDLSENQNIVMKKLTEAIEKLLKETVDTELTAFTTWYNDLVYKDIPFYHLIPHQALLPQESFRSFYIDHHWWNAILDGAISFGIHNTFDEVAIKIFKDWLLKNKMIDDRNGQWGFLIRSEAINDWEGIEFFAFTSAKGKTQIEPIIATKIGENLMLFIYKERPDRLEIREPKEGLQFHLGNMAMKRRELSGENIGKEKQGNEYVKIRERPGFTVIGETRGVIDVKALANEIGSEITGAGFALQLVKKPERLILKTNGDKMLLASDKKRGLGKVYLH